MILEKKTPLGLKIIELIVFHFVWYLILSLIYFNFNPFSWWLFTNIWGRVIFIFLEISIINFKFNNKNKKD